MAASPPPAAPAHPRCSGPAGHLRKTRRQIPPRILQAARRDHIRTGPECRPGNPAARTAPRRCVQADTSGCRHENPAARGFRGRPSAHRAHRSTARGRRRRSRPGPATGHTSGANHSEKISSSARTGFPVKPPAGHARALRIMVQMRERIDGQHNRELPRSRPSARHFRIGVRAEILHQSEPGRRIGAMHPRRRQAEAQEMARQPHIG